MINIGDFKIQNILFEVYNTLISFSTNSVELMDEIRKDFGSFETNSGLEVNGCMRIIKTEDSFPLRVPKYAIRETILPPDAAIYTVDNLRFIEQRNERILRLDFEKNEIVGYFKSPLKYTVFLRSLLKWVLIKALEKQGISFIHGSGVEKDGLSLFFIGPSGSGKTRTLLAFLLDGYNLITDDTIFLKDKKVFPFYIRSKILEDLVKNYPALKKGVNKKSTLLPGQGWHIDLGDIFPVQRLKVQPSKLFYIYVWNSEETKIEVISKKEMLSRLFFIYKNELSSSIWFNHEEEKAMRDIFPNYDLFVKEADCYKVYAGTDMPSFIKALKSK